MRDLELQARMQKSRSRAQQGRAPTPAKESPNKQVWFNLDEEPGSEPTLPTGMTLFLSGGEAIKQYTTPTPATMVPIDTQQPDHEERPQWSSTPPPKERGPKSCHPLTNPDQGQRGQIWWANPTHGSTQKCWRSPTDTGGKLWCPVAGWQCPFTSYMRASVNPIIGRQQHSDYLRPNRKQQDGGPLHLQSPDFASQTTCLPLLPPT